MRNFKSKRPDHLGPEVKAHLTAIRDAPTREAGEAAGGDVLTRFGKDCPGLCTALSEDVEALLNYLRVPWRHREHVRTTNLIERSLVEVRRRTKTIPRFFKEKSCLKLVYATLIRARHLAGHRGHGDGEGPTGSLRTCHEINESFCQGVPLFSYVCEQPS